jgi:hypothetical protein
VQAVKWATSRRVVENMGSGCNEFVIVMFWPTVVKAATHVFQHRSVSSCIDACILARACSCSRNAPSSFWLSEAYRDTATKTQSQRCGIRYLCGISCTNLCGFVEGWLLAGHDVIALGQMRLVEDLTLSSEGRSIRPPRNVSRYQSGQSG